MALITWEENYSVNVKVFDEHHRRLVELINKLNEGMKSGKGNDVLGSILSDLVNYTVFHFNAEEKMFQKYSYVGYLEHQKQHASFTKQAIEMRDNFKSGKVVLSVEVMAFLKDWLIKHICGTDKKYSPFLNSKGVV